MNQNKLNFCALLIRKYNLGNRDYFFREFSFAENEHLVESWNHALRNIKHRDIIKNAKKVDQHEVELIDRKIKEISSKKYQTIHYLYSKFDVKELKLTQENIERRVRHHLSTKLVEQLRKQLESKILVEKRQQSIMKNQVMKLGLAQNAMMDGTVKQLVEEHAHIMEELPTGKWKHCMGKLTKNVN